MKNAPQCEASSGDFRIGFGKRNFTPPRLPRKQPKIHRVLAALVTGRSFNRFEAQRELHDHCLHSTIAEIQTRFGIQVHRVTERVPCLDGNATADVKRYRLLPIEIAKARELLGVAS